MATLYYGVRANLVINGASTKHRGISRVIIHEKFDDAGEDSKYIDQILKPDINT